LRQLPEVQISLSSPALTVGRNFTCSMHIRDMIKEKLRSENIDAFFEEKWRIAWRDSHNEEHYISDSHVAYSENRLAWFQSDLHSQHLLRVFENKGSFKWEPITYNPVSGCDCLLIKWYSGHLIFIYKEKHDTYICSVKNDEVKTFNFHGDQIIKRGNLALFKSYGPDTGLIQRFDLSTFSSLEPISSEQAKLEDIYPNSVDVIIGLEEKS
jgi:hypothetical protein